VTRAERVDARARARCGVHFMACVSLCEERVRVYEVVSGFMFECG
jgi:hypothetical protein